MIIHSINDYMVKGIIMKKIIAVILCFACVFFIGCNQKISIEDTTVTTALSENIAFIESNYYLKYQNKNFLSKDVKDLYVKVADGLNTAYRVSFGSVTFDNTQKVKFNIGNNSYIYTLAFYKKDKSLYVFSPLLAIESGNNNVLLFCVDGLYFSVKVYEGKSSLKFVNAISDGGEVTKDTNLADRIVITHKVQSIDNLLDVNLQKNENEIQQNHLFFIRKSYQKYSHPTEYILYKKDSQSDVRLEYKDITSDINNGDTVYMDIKITAFGGGDVEFDLYVKG